jgi:hypothetical protein
MSNVQGMDALMRRLKAIGEPEPLLRALQLSTIHEAQALVHRKTGTLQRRIIPGAISSGYAIVKADTPYAAPLEFGSKPHVIRPKNAKVLAWGGSRRLSARLRSGSKPDHFAAFVHHPGSKPYPYLIPGAKKATAGMKDVIVAQWNSAA